MTVTTYLRFWINSLKKYTLKGKLYLPSPNHCDGLLLHQTNLFAVNHINYTILRHLSVSSQWKH